METSCKTTIQNHHQGTEIDTVKMPAAAALIPPLAQELPYAAGMAIEKNKEHVHE